MSLKSLLLVVTNRSFDKRFGNFDSVKKALRILKFLLCSNFIFNLVSLVRDILKNLKTLTLDAKLGTTLIISTGRWVAKDWVLIVACKFKLGLVLFIRWAISWLRFAGVWWRPIRVLLYSDSQWVYFPGHVRDRATNQLGRLGKVNLEIVAIEQIINLATHHKIIKWGGLLLLVFCCLQLISSGSCWIRSFLFKAAHSFGCLKFLVVILNSSRFIVVSWWCCLCFG